MITNKHLTSPQGASLGTPTSLHPPSYPLHPLPLRPNAQQLFCPSLLPGSPAGPGGGSSIQSGSPGWPGPLLGLVGYFCISFRLLPARSCPALGGESEDHSRALAWLQGGRERPPAQSPVVLALVPTDSPCSPRSCCPGLLGATPYSSRGLRSSAWGLSGTLQFLRVSSIEDLEAFLSS